MRGSLATVRAVLSSHPGLRRRVSSAVDAVLAASRTTPPGLRGGPQGVPEDQLRTVVVAVLGADAATVASTLDDLHRAAGLHGALRVVVAVEGEHLTAVRRAGFAAEQLSARHEWTEGPQTWEGHLRERLGSARADYAADGVLVLGSAGTTGTPPELLAAAVPRARTGRVRRRVQAAVSRVERAVDASPDRA